VITLDEVVGFLHNPLPYEQKLVSIINDKGEQIPLSHYSELYSYQNKTVKLEGMEKYSPSIFYRCSWYKIKHAHAGAVTCHGFIAHENSPSFGMHTDPDDVIIYCVDGEKSLIIDDKYTTLKVGEEVFIPANTPHMALNEKSAFTLSFGLEKFLIHKAKNYELDAIPENNRNLQS